MSYLVLARKYRPQTFKDVVGQEYITQTLQNALANKKLGHAYLFSGPRGVGKTTTARIFAKALNCTNRKGSEPCNKCVSCEEISFGAALDVIEIDGASNRQIDDVRALRENVKFAPSHSLYKVYIIDEVHMLTVEAFNALLKTLEEPPAHIIFIFATTQPHKVPTTILSRCQRFNFRQISVDETVKTLKRIATMEKIEINDDALSLIAKSASGSLRDALTIFDEVIALNPLQIVYEDVEAILGIIDYRILIDFGDIIAAKDTRKSLSKIEELINSGYDLSQFIKDLREHFRNLLMVKTTDDFASLVTLASGDLENLKVQAVKFSENDLLRVIDTLTNVDERIKYTNQKRLIVEVGIFKLCSPFVSLEQIMKNIELLEKKLNIAEKNNPDGKIDRTNPTDHIRQPIVDSVKPPVVNLPRQEFSPGNTTVSEDLQDLRNKWGDIIRTINSKKGSLTVFLSVCQPIEIANGTVILAFNKDDKFARESVDRNENKDLVSKCIEEIIHKQFKIKCQLMDNNQLTNNVEPQEEAISDKEEKVFKAGQDGTKPKEPSLPKGKDTLYTPKEIVRQEPIIEKAIDIFNGEIADTE